MRAALCRFPKLRWLVKAHATMLLESASERTWSAYPQFMLHPKYMLRETLDMTLIVILTKYCGSSQYLQNTRAGIKNEVALVLAVLGSSSAVKPIIARHEPFILRLRKDD